MACARAAWHRRANLQPKPEGQNAMVGATYDNPLGRVSLAAPVAPPGPDQAPILSRASVVNVATSDMAPAGPSLAVRGAPLRVCVRAWSV
jgi:hypothetical protein